MGEKKKWDHIGPAGEERKEFLHSFIFQVEGRQEMIINANHLSLLKNALKKISASLKTHLLSVQLRNKDDENWSGMFLKSINNKKDWWADLKPDNQMKIRQLHEENEQQGQRSCWVEGDLQKPCWVSIAALATLKAPLLLLKNSITYFDYSPLLNSGYK